MDYYPPPIAPLSNTGTNHNDEHHGNYRGTTKRNKRLHCETDRPRLAPEPRVLLYPTLHNTKPERWAAAPVDQYKRTLNTIMPPSPRTPPPSRPPRGLFNSRSQKIVSPPLPHRVTKPKISIPTRSPIIRQNHQSYLRYQRIGPAQVKVFRLQLPMELIHSLDPIVTEAERYAQEVLPNGWNTSLYSLTKQDVAMRDIPGMARRIRPICEYISEAIRTLYGANKVVVDQNQPHILKYSVDSGHTGVELHHDCCDVTANLALSSSGAYEGGGTYIPDLSRVVKLERGECLLHPGSLIHGGMEVTKGNRYLMVTFAHLK